MSVERYAGVAALDPAPLFAGLEHLRGARAALRHVPFDDVALLFDRFAATSDDALERYAAHFCRGFPLLSLVAAHVASTRQLYQATFFTWERVYPMFQSRHDQTATGFNLTTALDPDRRACRAMFAAVRAVLERLPRALGQPDARVDAAIDDRAATYRVSLDDVGAVDEAFAPEVIFAGLRRDALAQVPTAFVIPAAWELTPAEARVVELLVAGQPHAQIARALGVSIETVRTHSKRAMHKAGVHRQAELVARALRQHS